MNKKLAFVLASAAIMMTSCMEWTSQYTPSLAISAFVTASGDTLSGHYYSEDYYSMDTIQVGDTATFMFFSQSYSNNLVSNSVSWDSTMVKMWPKPLDKEFQQLLLPTSDPEALRFDYITGYNYTAIPIQLLPLKIGTTKIQFQVVSDSKYSEKNGIIEIRIADRKK